VEFRPAGAPGPCLRGAFYLLGGSSGQLEAKAKHPRDPAFFYGFAAKPKGSCLINPVSEERAKKPPLQNLPAH